MPSLVFVEASKEVLAQHGVEGDQVFAFGRICHGAGVLLVLVAGATIAALLLRGAERVERGSWFGAAPGWTLEIDSNVAAATAGYSGVCSILYEENEVKKAVWRE